MEKKKRFKTSLRIAHFSSFYPPQGSPGVVFWDNSVNRLACACGLVGGHWIVCV